MSNCTWYVEPLSPETNATIAEQLQNMPGASMGDQMVCQDGRLHNLWRCPFNFVSQLLRSGKKSGLQFKIFRKRGGEAPQPADFLTKHKKRPK